MFYFFFFKILITFYFINSCHVKINKEWSFIYYIFLYARPHLTKDVQTFLKLIFLLQWLSYYTSVQRSLNLYFLRYPHCLHMLELLQYEHFRKELVNAQCAKFIDEQQILHWQHYSRKRTRMQQALAEQQQQPQAPSHGNTTSKWSSQHAPAGNYSFTNAFSVVVKSRFQMGFFHILNRTLTFRLLSVGP